MCPNSFSSRLVVVVSATKRECSIVQGIRVVRLLIKIFYWLIPCRFHVFYNKIAILILKLQCPLLFQLPRQNRDYSAVGQTPLSHPLPNPIRPLEISNEKASSLFCFLPCRRIPLAEMSSHFLNGNLTTQCGPSTANSRPPLKLFLIKNPYLRNKKKQTTTNTAMGIQSQNRNGSIKTMKKKGTQAKKKRTSHSRMVIGGSLEFALSFVCYLQHKRQGGGKKNTKKDIIRNVRIERNQLAKKNK